MKGKYYHLIMERFMLALTLLAIGNFFFQLFKFGRTDWIILIFASITGLLYWMRRKFRKRNF